MKRSELSQILRPQAAAESVFSAVGDDQGFFLGDEWTEDLSMANTIAEASSWSWEILRRKRKKPYKRKPAGLLAKPVG